MLDRPVENPVLVFGILMLIALVAPLLSSRLKTPATIGLIITGIFIGPYALGVLDRSPAIQLLSDVGLLYIMFLAGLELDRNLFIRHRYHSLVFGILTFTVPLVVGMLLARYVLNFEWPAAILLASLFSSHTLITFPIVSNLRLVRQRAVTTTIGGTIFTDTAALLVLAIVAASYHETRGMFFWPKLFFFMALYVAAMILILPRLSRWFFRNIAADGIVSFTGVMATLYLGSYLAHVAGLEPILGAFLVGLILNSFIPEKSTLMSRIQFVGHSIFIPIFLISVGMLINVRSFFADSETMLIAAVMVFASLATKWGAAYPTQKLLKYTSDEARLIYGMSVNQAAATLAAVLVGYNLGIFGESVLSGSIVMILVTIAAGSWITDRYARRVAIKEEAEPYHSAQAPQRVLVPLANPEKVAELMDMAMLIRRRASHEPIYPLNIVLSGDTPDQRIPAAEKLLGQAVVQALEADVPVTPVTRIATDIPVGVQQAAIELRASIIVAGWKGTPTSTAYTFGRKLDAMLDGSTQMVLVSRCLMPLNTTERVVLAIPPMIDRQPGFTIAISSIKTLANQVNASLTVVSTGPTMANAGKIIKSSQPKLQQTDVELRNWKELLPWLHENLEVNDLLTIVSVRKGRLAWQPDLSRLPRLVNRQFPKVNHVIIYPPDKSWDEVIGAEKIGQYQSSFLPANHIDLDLHDSTILEAASRLLSVEFFNQPHVLRRISDQVAHLALTEPTQLLPGIVLVHTHISEIYAPTAFLGINTTGWSLPNTTASAQALLILLSPANAPPESHLKSLADLVRPLHQFKTVEQLTGLRSIDEILKLFYDSH